jgi:glycine dehydrogenase subunit 1
LYIPATEDEQKRMLERIGLKRIEDLFDSIPPELRLQRPLDLPPALTEMELTAHMSELSRRNLSAEDAPCFLGGGAYDHFIPAVVDAIASRSEYYTSYTPYQPEVSQGTLQTSFEFQTMICELTGLDAANASLYEGATAVVEAVHLALGAVGREGRVLVSETVHPEYRETLATYLANLPTRIETIPAPGGETDLDALARALGPDVAAVVLQSPNFFGIVESVAKAVEIAHEAGAMLIQSFDPISLGILKRPGDMGVDVAVGEGQSLGNPLSYGGPYLGLFACRRDQIRRMPGRIVGETVDRKGNRCFVLTLQTREQHIRREKATSNICTNQGLLALRSAVYLALMGPEGLKEVAELCWHKAHYAARELARLPGFRLRFDGVFFKEFVLETPGPAERYAEALVERGWHAGVPLGGWYKGMENCLLVAVTEKRTKAEIDGLAAAFLAAS